MTGGTVNRAILRIALKVFHLCKLLVDHSMHGAILRAARFGRLSSLAKSVFDVTVSARDAEIPKLIPSYRDDTTAPACPTQVVLNIEVLNE